MPRRRSVLTAVLAIPVASVFARQVRAASPSIYAEDGIAIDGTDPVAYFTEGRPVPGSPKHFLDWRGATWRFSTADNLFAFESDPERYAPEFGGYCAWAVAEGYIASTVPEAWHIEDGRLYLNFSRRVQRRWLRDVPGNIARGNANWPAVLDR